MPEMEAPEKRKRGRPRKAPATPAASADALSTEKESAEPVVKRGRGRPKGSTKKKDADPKPAGPKRPRGRPKGSVKKKTANKAEAPKKSSEWGTKCWVDVGSIATWALFSDTAFCNLAHIIYISIYITLQDIFFYIYYQRNSAYVTPSTGIDLLFRWQRQYSFIVTKCLSACSIFCLFRAI